MEDQKQTKNVLLIPERGKVYLIKHASGLIKARFIGEKNIRSMARASFGINSRTRTYYLFKNLRTGRDITLKSRARIRREVTA